MIVNMCDRNVLGGRPGLLKRISKFDFNGPAVAAKLKAKNEEAVRWIKNVRTQLAVSERECQNVCINV